MNKIPYNKLNEEMKKNIINEYYKNKKLNFLQLSNKLNVSERSISRVLKENNINGRLKNRYIILRPNYFETIDTEEKAYFLGFIYADGAVGYYNNIIIGLANNIENKILLNKFISEIGITTGFKIVNNENNSLQLHFSCKKMWEDLNCLGVIPNKTSKLDSIPNIDKSLYNHFIRGYFDGDGTICTYYDTYDNRQRYLFEILGTELFLINMQNILVKSCGVKQTKLHKTHSDCVTRISYKGIKSIIKIRDFLYENATIFLYYKKERFYNINSPLCQ